MPRSDKTAIYNPGEPIIYRLTKQSPRPGPRAENVSPSAHGDNYTYTVDKFWVVVERLGSGRILARTRGGKERILNEADPNLRHARRWERWLFKHRFPSHPDPEPGVQDKAP